MSNPPLYARLGVQSFASKSKVFLTLSVLMFLQLLYFFYISDDLFGLSSYSSAINKHTHQETRHEMIDSVESILKSKNSIDIQKNYTRFWRFDSNLRANQIGFDPITFLKGRDQRHQFDPRISYSIYLNHITKQFLENDPNNSPNYNVAIPFSWQDWVDLSPLNKYLEFNEDEKPTCKDILTKGLSYEPSPDTTEPDFDAACIDNSNFDNNGLTPKHLLPGFNFIRNSGKPKPFTERIIHAKSYILSSAPLPNSILFLSKGGSYEVFPTRDETMFQSGLYDEYMKDHADDNTQLTDVNPVAEFRKLISAIPPTKSEVNFGQLFTSKNNYEYQIPFESFIYDHEALISTYKSKESLTAREQRHLNNLEYSASFDESKVPNSFAQVSIPWPDKFNGHSLEENGAHYDYRFFNGFITESQINSHDDTNEKRKIVLHRMIHTWLQFTYNTGLVTFIAHGSLLSWYWDGMVFEWDEDIDVQMPIMDLDKFSMMYNHSLIVEDLNFGYHKYFVDVGTSLTHRTKGIGNNNIDARFIDVDSGLYIDITGIAVSGTQKIPEEYQALWEKHHDKREDPPPTQDAYTRNKQLQIMNCRNNHFYSYSDLSPVRLSQMENSPAIIPHNFKPILFEEYPKGMTRSIYNKYIYIDDLRLWIHIDLVYAAARSIGYDYIDQDSVISFYYKHAVEVLNIVLSNDDVLKEFYLTYELTKQHEAEMSSLKKIDKGIATRDDFKKYWELVESFKGNYNSPLRKDFFSYVHEVLALGERDELD